MDDTARTINAERFGDTKNALLLPALWRRMSVEKSLEGANDPVLSTVESEGFNRRPAHSRDANQLITMPAKVIVPPLLARMKQVDCPPAFGIGH